MRESPDQVAAERLAITGGFVEHRGAVLPFVSFRVILWIAGWGGVTP